MCNHSFLICSAVNNNIVIMMQKLIINIIKSMIKFGEEDEEGEVGSEQWRSEKIIKYQWVE